MKHGLPLVITLSAVLVSGCGTDRIIHDPNPNLISPTEVGVAFSDRDARVKIDGNPFVADRQRFEAAIVASMQEAWFRTPTHFTTTPDESVNDAYKVVMVFNPEDGVSRRQLCGAAPIATKPPASEAVVIRAAFCRYAIPAVSVRGYVYDLESPDDARLKSTIGGLMTALFSRRTPDRMDSDGGGFKIWMN